MRVHTSGNLMQPANSIAKRALALGLITLRAQAENGIARHDAESAEFQDYGEYLLNWAVENGIAACLSGSERELHDKPLGAWTHEEIYEAFWRVEALKAILWAGGYLPEMPDYFDIGDPNTIYAIIPVEESVAGFLSQAARQPEDALANELKKAEFLHWRARNEQLRLAGRKPPRGDTHEAVIQRALQGILAEGIELDHDNTDILVTGQRFADLDAETQDTIVTICVERHVALEWICSNDEDWDGAPDES